VVTTNSHLPSMSSPTATDAVSTTLAIVTDVGAVTGAATAATGVGAATAATGATDGATGAATAGAGAATVGAGAAVVVKKDSTPAFECPPDLKKVVSQNATLATVVVTNLVLALQADDTPITARKITLLTNVVAFTCFGDANARAADVLLGLLDTLRPDTATDDIIYALDATLGCFARRQPTALTTRVKTVILAALRNLCPANKRALCAYMVHHSREAAEADYAMLDAAVRDCCEMVDSHQPVTGFRLRMLDACLRREAFDGHIAHKAQFVAIVNKCGPSAASLEHLWKYAVHVNKVIACYASDPKAALQLTMACPSTMAAPEDCVIIMDKVNTFKEFDEELLLAAAAWLDVHLMDDVFKSHAESLHSAFGLVLHLSGSSEKVARAVAASATIMAYMKRFAGTTYTAYLYEKLVFWWAQVQWQSNNLPVAKRVLDVKTKFVPGGMQFRPVEAPAPFPLDILAVRDFVTAEAWKGIGRLPAAAITSMHNILSMVYNVAPKVILDNPAAHLYIIENSAQLPELCAAILMAGPVTPGTSSGGL
jgi:hypothetical protein